MKFLSKASERADDLLRAQLPLIGHSAQAIPLKRFLLGVMSILKSCVEAKLKLFSTPRGRGQGVVRMA